MKTNKIEQNKPKTMNVICYDDENIIYYDGVITTFTQNTDFTTDRYVDGTLINNVLGYDIIIRVPDLNTNENIKLDDTLMKRIAVYNKKQECIRLDKQIQEKENKIKELDNLLQDKEKRWSKVKEYIKNIYEINLEYDDYEDYDEYDD